MLLFTWKKKAGLLAGALLCAVQLGATDETLIDGGGHPSAPAARISAPAAPKPASSRSSKKKAAKKHAAKKRNKKRR